MEREQRLIASFLGSARASRAGDRALAVANFRSVVAGLADGTLRLEPSLRISCVALQNLIISIAHEPLELA
jgi:hypothetical protein